MTAHKIIEHHTYYEIGGLVSCWGIYAMTAKQSVHVVYAAFGLLILFSIATVSYLVYFSNIQEEHRIAHNVMIYKASKGYIKTINIGGREYDVFLKGGKYSIVCKNEWALLNLPYSVIYRDMGFINQTIVEDMINRNKPYSDHGNKRIPPGDYISPHKKDYDEKIYKPEYDNIN